MPGWKPPQWPDDDPLGTFTSMPWVPKSHDLLIWKTKGLNCPACQRLAGRVYPLAYWNATILPGWHEHCNCYLSSVKSYVLESPRDLWGTDPFWWDPTMSVWDFLSDLYQRYIKWLGNRGKGDEFSGFDNLYPVFQSHDMFTTPGWTLLHYTLQTRGLNEIVGNFKALLTSSHLKPTSYLPWEGTNVKPKISN